MGMGIGDIVKSALVAGATNPDRSYANNASGMKTAGPSKVGQSMVTPGMVTLPDGSQISVDEYNRRQAAATQVKEQNDPITSYYKSVMSATQPKNLEGT